ncbi:hypothetical protein RF679_09545 [Undibacterium cyanobacteriorum]|uniref:DUF4124 domain-containing protein n=1 Tax=Undibacterium cyanobacteriorum TaxID=3073561 RepID=A0ABY9RF18_9BURK|nr:hypothetical protein [Undibacterium sp. 20NA77.5]WMW78910.1 hypothetical protein RF679_09545 [Undibacterium sp. 20NA77.5]
MTYFFRFLFLFAAIIVSSDVSAQAFVCSDAQGQRSFSSTPCDKKGLQNAPKQAAPTNPKVINAMVITDKPKNNGHDATVLPGQIKMERESRYGTPTAIFLLTMMSATAGLFILLFMRFFRAHHGKLTLKRTDRD